MLQRNLLMTGALAALIGLTVGCEWTGTSSDESWNDAYSWVNFSGTYRLYVVNVSADDEDGSEKAGTLTKINVVNENHGTTVNGKQNYSGTLRETPIVANSVTIQIGEVVFRDDGAEKLVGANGGTIEYGTGAWSARTQEDTGPGLPIRASYTYERSGSVINPSQPGKTGATLTQIIVIQQGNLLTFTDNNAVVYNGRITGAKVPSDSSKAGNDRQTFEVTAANSS